MTGLRCKFAKMYFVLRQFFLSAKKDEKARCHDGQFGMATIHEILQK